MYYIIILPYLVFQSPQRQCEIKWDLSYGNVYLQNTGHVDPDKIVVFPCPISLIQSDVLESRASCEYQKLKGKLKIFIKTKLSCQCFFILIHHSKWGTDLILGHIP